MSLSNQARSAAPYQALLEVSESITRPGDLAELFHDLRGGCGPSSRLMAPVSRDFGIRSGYYLPLTTARRRLGTINFASATPRRYDPSDLELFQHAARLAALAVDGAASDELGDRRPIRGGGGLGLKRTTLQSKMRKLGIMRPG